MSGTTKIHSYTTDPITLLDKLAQPYSAWSLFLKKHGEHAFESRGFWRAFFYAMPEETRIVVTEAYKGGSLVALLWGGLKQVSRKKILRERRLVAYRSGISSVDQIWPEMNTLLLSPEFDLPEELMLRAWHKEGRVAVSEWHVVPASDAEAMSGKKDMIEGGGMVDLRHPYTSPASVRRAVRQTERYSQRHFESELSLVEKTGENAWHSLCHHNVHHREKWRGTTTPSGFESHDFTSVLRRWICALDDTVSVYELNAGKRALGCVVILKEAHAWRYYLSSFAPPLPNSQQNHYHPGYWAHDRLIALAMNAGMDWYDFMAGDERYKRQFANCPIPQYYRLIRRTRTTCFSLAEKLYELLPKNS